MIYDVDYFINKFQAISESLFCTDNFVDGVGRMCVQGHCGIRNTNKGLVWDLALSVPPELSEARSFYRLVKEALHACPGSINNGRDSRYLQPTPKQRILAALYDIKAMQEPKDTVKKERIVYVSVPVSITEQSKDLVLS